MQRKGAASARTVRCYVAILKTCGNLVGAAPRRFKNETKASYLFHALEDGTPTSWFLAFMVWEEAASGHGAAACAIKVLDVRAAFARGEHRNGVHCQQVGAHEFAKFPVNLYVNRHQVRMKKGDKPGSGGRSHRVRNQPPKFGWTHHAISAGLAPLVARAVITYEPGLPWIGGGLGTTCGLKVRGCFPKRTAVLWEQRVILHDHAWAGHGSNSTPHTNVGQVASNASARKLAVVFPLP